MKITEEQFKDLYFFRDMFNNHADYLERVCESNYDKMASGYHIGSTSNYLKQHATQLQELILNIENANRR